MLEYFNVQLSRTNLFGKVDDSKSGSLPFESRNTPLENIMSGFAVEQSTLTNSYPG